MKFCVLIYRTVRVGDFPARVTFLVVQNFSVDCLTATMFIDSRVQTVVPGLWMLVSYYSPSVALTGQRSLIKLKKGLTLKLKERFRKNQDNAENRDSATIKSKSASRMPDWMALLRPEYAEVLH